MAEPGAEVPVAVTEQQTTAEQQQNAAEGDGAVAQDVTASGSQGGDGAAGALQPAADAPAAAAQGADEPAADVKAEPLALATADAAVEPTREGEDEAAQQQAADKQAAVDVEQVVKEVVKEEEGATVTPSDEALVARLRALLAEVDLATTTGGCCAQSFDQCCCGMHMLLRLAGGPAAQTSPGCALLCPAHTRFVNSAHLGRPAGC